MLSPDTTLASDPPLPFPPNEEPGSWRRSTPPRKRFSEEDESCKQPFLSTSSSSPIFFNLLPLLFVLSLLYSKNYVFIYVCMQSYHRVRVKRMEAFSDYDMMAFLVYYAL